jgi:hypothetical protein
MAKKEPVKKTKKKKKAAKKQAVKYDDKLVLNGTFDELLKGTFDKE